MKAVILMVPMFMLALLSGCTEQTQMTGPSATIPNLTDQGINEPFESVKFEEMVVGPGGAKFFVSGSVDYSLSFNGTSYALITTLNADVSLSGALNSWTIASGKRFKSILNDEGFDVVSEHQDFAGKFPQYRFILDYSVDIHGMKVANLRVASATTAEGI